MANERDRLRGLWRNMRMRCSDPKDISYHRYGARGIFVCEQWLVFQVFYEWAVSHGAQKGLQLDREDNDGPYSPENCRFVTPTVNARNKRNTRYITAWGERKNLTAWAEDPRCVVAARAVLQRIQAGMAPERALTLASTRGSPTCRQGHERPLGEKCRECNRIRMASTHSKNRGL